jgi:hypothetical protein
MPVVRLLERDLLVLATYVFVSADLKVDLVRFERPTSCVAGQHLKNCCQSKPTWAGGLASGRNDRSPRRHWIDEGVAM